MTAPAPTELLKLAEWLCHEQARFASSIACNDPAIKAHIATLKTWEGAVRQAASVERAGCGDPSCRDPNCEYGKGPNTDFLCQSVERAEKLDTRENCPECQANGLCARHAYMERHGVERAEVAGEAVLTLGEAFEIGFCWRGQLQGQSIEDSRAVGRTLQSDIFEKLPIDTKGFNSFATGDAGIVEAKRRIFAALASPPPRSEAQASQSGESATVAQASRPRAFLAWAVEMFGPVAKLRSERLLRFVEEAIELAHAEGMERNILVVMADRVYSRPVGDTAKEIGQAQACLETFAENIGLSSADEAEREWQRVQGIPQEEWTRRHSAKQALGIALPSAQLGGPDAGK